MVNTCGERDLCRPPAEEWPSAEGKSSVGGTVSVADADPSAVLYGWYRGQIYSDTVPATEDRNGSGTLTVQPTEERHPPHSAATSQYLHLQQRSYPRQRVTPLRAVCRDLFPWSIKSAPPAIPFDTPVTGMVRTPSPL